MLELEIGTIWPKIQNKFKTLVKRFHPDMNLGNKIYENKLKKHHFGLFSIKDDL